MKFLMVMTNDHVLTHPVMRENIDFESPLDLIVRNFQKGPTVYVSGIIHQYCNLKFS